MKAVLPNTPADQFKYIPCKGSTAPPFSFSSVLAHLNTSHVKVQPNLYNPGKGGEFNLNTSHVKVQLPLSSMQE